MNRWSALPRTARIVVALLGVAVIVGAGSLVWARSTDLPDDAVLRFDDRTVTTAQLDERVDVMNALYGVEEPSGDEQEQFRRDFAKSTAVSLILEADAADHDIVISDKQAQDELDALIDAQLTGGREAFVEFLASHDLSEADVTDEIKRTLATSRLAEDVTGDVEEVSDAEVRAFFDENRAEMVSPAARRLSNIVVSSRTDAQRVAQRARAGEDFAELAGIWSRDGSTSSKGGDLGVLTADQLEPAYAEAAFAGRTGTIFGPVQTQSGWNVGKVVSVRAAVPVAFSELEESLRAELTNRERLEVWRDYLGDLLEDAGVEYADDYRPDDPTAPPTQLPETR